MNFDFPPELKELGETARSFLAENCGPVAARRAIACGSETNRQTWQTIAEMGWLSASIPERDGGLGLGHLAVCVIATEMGRAISPLPFSSSVYLATEALLLYGSPEQKAEWLARLASGDAIGTLAVADKPGFLQTRHFDCSARKERLFGQKPVVADCDLADFAIVAAIDEQGLPALYLTPLSGSSVAQSPVQTIDPSRGHAQLDFKDHPAAMLPGSQRTNAIGRLIERAAVMVAFEQLGVAEAALDMACVFAKERYAFGRPIGSFQAIKHKLADVYIANELARSNCYYGAWALQSGADELAEAAAVSRIAASDAAWQATKENIQTHGGMGFTWDLDCHLYYRRAGLLSLVLGGTNQWKRNLMATLRCGEATA